MRTAVIILAIAFAANITVSAQDIEYKSLQKDTLAVEMSADSLYQLLSTGTMAEVYVENAVYRADTSFHSSIHDFYFLKFHLKNRSNRTIGFQLVYSKIFYPNFMCYHCLDIGKSGEGRIVQSENDYEQLKKQFEDGKLVLIEPHGQLSYYRNFNERKEKMNFDNLSSEFGIRLDGQLLCTDGKEVELYRLDDKPLELRTIMFTYPIRQKQIPKDGKWMFTVEDATEYEY